MGKSNYVIGVDFGTDSVRSIIVDSSNGEVMGSSVENYPRWSEGKYCDPVKNQFRQHPLDYIESMERSIKTALAMCPAGTSDSVRGIAVDTTGSTPVAVDKNGTPLSLIDEFKDNPNAMFVLWKDHTAIDEADEINHLAKTWGGEDYTKYEGGIYSSEWWWSKIAHIVRADAKVSGAAFSWIEHCDWIPALLTGSNDPLSVKRSRCAAGHKSMWHASWKGLPPEEFLTKIEKGLSGLRARLYSDTFTSDKSAGVITAEWAKRLGMPGNAVIGVGAFDCHMGAVGAGITPYILTKVVGTSTCDIMVAPMNDIEGRLVRGICGQVDGSVIPGLMGLEAGQSAFGDVYAWFRDMLSWPIENILPKYLKGDKKATIDGIIDDILPGLTDAAERISLDESGAVAVDWLNGRRTPDANQKLKGTLSGLTLGTGAPAVFRALIEATAFGAKKIADRFIEEGVRIDGVLALGGIPKKSPFVMQVMADVFGMPVKVSSSEQACALGAAMFAAVAAGLYPDVQAAIKAMGHGYEKEYAPNQAMTKKYQSLYGRYSDLCGYIESKTK
jgi:L-ribulokinase